MDTEMLMLNIEMKSRDLVKPKGDTLIITLGEGNFDFDPSYVSPLRGMPVYNHRYEDATLDVPKNFHTLTTIAASELARLRSDPMRMLALNYSPSTYVGNPEQIGEEDDIQLMGFLLQQFPTKIVYAGDFINGLGVQRDCFYQKVMEFHSLQQKELQEGIKEGLLHRIDNRIV